MKIFLKVYSFLPFNWDIDEQAYQAAVLRDFILNI